MKNLNRIKRLNTTEIQDTAFTPSNKPQFLSLWAINGELDQTKASIELKNLKSAGINGVVFHPRYYPGKPPYLSTEYYRILSEIIREAKKLEMQFWIYDENGWPSGRADGMVIDYLKNCTCEWIEYHDGIVINKRKQVNTLSKTDMDTFLTITYDGYKNGLDFDSFEYIAGFFSDEVGLLDGSGVSMENGGIPYNDEILQLYKNRYHQDISHKLDCLFLEKDDYQIIRRNYWMLLSEILASNFYKRINDWCKKNNKKYTAHIKGEENPFFEIAPNGSAFKLLKEVMIPGIDALERYPGNHFYPRIASSLAKQFQNGESMAEALGGSGWGLTPQDLEKYIDWLAECGINTFIFHICQYTENSASVYDWPPNIPLGLSWSHAFSEVLYKATQKWDQKIYSKNDVLLVVPGNGVRSYYNPKDALSINEHNGSNVPDSKSGRISNRFINLAETMYFNGLNFDVAEEWIIDEYGTIEGNGLRIGKCTYSLVVIPNDAIFDNSKLIAELYSHNIALNESDFVYNVDLDIDNQLLLNNNCSIPLINASEEDLKNIAIYSLDELSSLKIMDVEISKKQRNNHVNCSQATTMNNDGYYYKIPENLIFQALSGNLISISYKCDSCNPVVFLKGHFQVKSISGYKKFGNRQLTTSGYFYLDFNNNTPIINDLISSGYPFCNKGIKMSSKIWISNDGMLKIHDRQKIYADLIDVYIDDIFMGSFWDKIELNNLVKGLHKLTLKLYPSTYNTYGPHQYYLGDHHIISPWQYKGEKNFADNADAPANTQTQEYHFVRFGIDF